MASKTLTIAIEGPDLDNVDRERVGGRDWGEGE